MSIRKKVNSSNDFEMSIIDFRPQIEDFNSLGFPKITNVWANNLEQQIEVFVKQTLRDHDEMLSFVRVQIENHRIKFIKVDPTNESHNGYCAHYICFGGDPDGSENSISFRIDQKWDDFLFPQDFNKGSIKYLKSIVGLSGAIIGRLDFPELMLSKQWLGNPKISYGYDGKGNIINSEIITKAIRDYFVLAQDYWGVAIILDKLGFVWLWNTRNQKDFEVRQTGLNLKEWFQAELKDPFRQRPKPDFGTIPPAIDNSVNS